MNYIQIVCALNASAIPLFRYASGFLLWQILRQSRRRQENMEDISFPAITRYRRTHKKYIVISLLFSLIAILSIPLLPSIPDLKFTAPTKADYMKIVKLHHSDPKLVAAIITVESNWKPKAVSNKGAIGLMQVLPTSGKIYAGVSRADLFDPEKNIQVGCKILKMYQRQSKTLGEALAKYSGGAANYHRKVIKEMRG
jgi:soluble lytic murein transglycosylase